MAEKVTQSYREAEKLIGAPAAELLRMPKGDDPAATKAFWQRLGAPAEATGYDLSGVTQGGKALAPEFVQTFQKMASDLNLPAGAAKEMAAFFAKTQEAQAASADVERSAIAAAQVQKLQKEWGVNWEANMFVAKQAVIALGLQKEGDGDIIAAMQNTVGYDRTMEFFRQVGVRVGEDKYVAGGNPAGANGVMTNGQAMARKQELMGDQAWVKRYLASDPGAIREMTALNTIISSAR